MARHDRDRTGNETCQSAFQFCLIGNAVMRHDKSDWRNDQTGDEASYSGHIQLSTFGILLVVINAKAYILPSLNSIFFHSMA